jgi:hypothetical protein
MLQYWGYHFFRTSDWSKINFVSKIKSRNKEERILIHTALYEFLMHLITEVPYHQETHFHKNLLIHATRH